MKTGIVKSFERGWGFIVDDDDNNEYFVHFSNIVAEGFKFLEVGDIVTYDIGPGNRSGVQAINVTLIGGDYEE